jgi:pyruvate-ferredoxin/flavodoxin oxidoreductase
MAKAVENDRGDGRLPHPDLPSVRPEEVPDFFSGCYGLGSRDTQPGDLIAAVEEMLPGASQKRQFYLGIDFVRKQSATALEGWQQQVAEEYPGLADLALERRDTVNLLPKSALALRIHSVGGWGAITMGKNISLTLFRLLGMNVKSNPKYGSEKKGHPTTFFAVFAREPIRLNCALLNVDVVVSPDPNAFKHSNPLAGLCEGGVFIIQSIDEPEALWQSIPDWARETIRKQKIRVFYLDGFRIAAEEASGADLRFRMQGAAFQGAFFRASPILERENLQDGTLFEGIRAQLQKQFGHRGERVVEDNLRVIQRGFGEVRELEWASFEQEVADEDNSLPVAPSSSWTAPSASAISDPDRFFEQVCSLYRAGSDPIADPFAALSAIPAATGVFRDLTDIRMEVPDFIADKCTGCGLCWIQCPDAAIPGLVTGADELLSIAFEAASEAGPLENIRGLIEPLAAEVRDRIAEEPFTTFADLLQKAYARVALRYPMDPDERNALDDEFDRLSTVLADLPLAKTSPFYTVPERAEKGSGGLLSITVNPYACKGCNLCVDVCPDEALVTVKQDDRMEELLRRNWSIWERLPDTPDRFINVRNMKQGIGVLHTLLLKKQNYRSIVGGDSSCSGCGEKTAIHLISGAIQAAMQERVDAFVERIDKLVQGLEAKVGGLLLSDADLDEIEPESSVRLDVGLSGPSRARVKRLLGLVKFLKDLSWRYTTGPSGKGRSALGITNATGCSSVWGSTYPYNPYPFPWVNHLFQDAPSIAVGIFEGQMRKMADAFRAVRESELELDDAYDPEVHEPFFVAFDWREFTDEEFLLCPPVLAVGGDGAMLDIGFQNLSRVLASGKPLRIVVLDTQVYSNTGGQACTSGFTGQVSDMAEYGPAQRGKEEMRKELSLLAIAHRTTFVLQSSQASHSHLLSGVLRGLASRRPAIFNIYTPCQPEHGIPDEASARAARMSLESRAFPFLVYDPDAGSSVSERLDLFGNPDLQERWPTYKLSYRDEGGAEKTMSLPVTIADWAAAEARFSKHFSRADGSSEDGKMVPFHEYLDLSDEDRADKTPFIYTLDAEKRLDRLVASEEIVQLAEERLALWADLKEMAGVQVSARIREGLVAQIRQEYEEREATLRKEYEARLAQAGTEQARTVVHRIVHGLFENGDGEEASAGSTTSDRGNVDTPAEPETPDDDA